MTYFVQGFKSSKVQGAQVVQVVQFPTSLRRCSGHAFPRAGEDAGGDIGDESLFSFGCGLRAASSCELFESLDNLPHSGLDNRVEVAA